MPDAKSSLYIKLAGVMGEVVSVDKDGRNDFHRYDYASAEQVMRSLRGPLLRRNVVLIPSVVDITEREFLTPKGKTSTLTTVRVKFTFVDGDSGESHECEWAGAGDDPADKGLYKAYTGAIKTFLRETFLLPQGDDPEADTGTDWRAGERIPAASPLPTIDGDRSALLGARATGLGIPNDTLLAAAEHVHGAHVGSLLSLTEPEAAALDRWLDKKEAASSPSELVPEQQGFAAITGDTQ